MGRAWAIAAAVVWGAVALGGTEGKKLIQFGWGMPSPQYIAEHWREMDRMPFDGVAITMPIRDERGRRVAFEWVCWTNRAVEWSKLRPMVGMLRRARFENLRHNFLRFNATPGDVDWFGDFSAVVHNARMVARLAYMGGCRGILFDPEAYQRPVWRYLSQKWAKEKSFREYCERVRWCGRQFMRAICEEYPNVVVLMCWAYSVPYYECKGDLERLPYVNYSLLPAFVDGMLEGAHPAAIIVDGHESSYTYRHREQFLEAYRAMLSGALVLTRFPRLFKRHMRAGFGIWLDPGGPKRWDGRNPANNPVTPGLLRKIVYHALDVSDEYVWLYSQGPRFWPPKDLPEEYLVALKLARISPEPAVEGREVEEAEPGLPGPYASARDHPGWQADEVFAVAWRGMRAVCELDGRWKFRTDPEKRGEAEGWWKEDYNDSAWREIQVPEWWECQGVYYNGWAWYRVKFRVPGQVRRAKRVVLAFGGVDEVAWVWVNGRFAGKHDIGPEGWDKPFGFDVARLVRPGRENTLAVLVFDSALYGGIWRPVKILVDE